MPNNKFKKNKVRGLKLVENVRLPDTWTSFKTWTWFREERPEQFRQMMRLFHSRSVDEMVEDLLRYFFYMSDIYVHFDTPRKEKKWGEKEKTPRHYLKESVTHLEVYKKWEELNGERPGHYDHLFHLLNILKRYYGLEAVPVLKTIEKTTHIVPFHEEKMYEGKGGNTVYQNGTFVY